MCIRDSLFFVPLNTRDPRPMLEQGQADAAVGFFPDVNAALRVEGAESAMRSRPLYNCRYVCVMRRDHPLAETGALTLAAYCAAQHVRVSFAGRPRGFVDESLAALGLKRRVIVTVNQFSTAGSVVQNTDLLTVLPRSFLPATGCQAQLAVSYLEARQATGLEGYAWGARESSSIRVLSARIDPPVTLLEGSTASTARRWPRPITCSPSASTKVDLPTPGAPLMPMRIERPACGSSASSTACPRCW